MSGRKIFLLSCSARKLERTAPAEELYQGTLFRASLEWARQQAPDAIYILSAKHHLLNPDQKIEPYDLTLNDLPAHQLKVWAGTVMEQMKQHTDPQRDHFVILAGEKYRRYLMPHLKHASLPLEGLPIGKQVQFLQRQLASRDCSADLDQTDCGGVHGHLSALPRHRFPFDAETLPENGIYILFERGESAHGTDRIVRIGTHTGDGQLPNRLREHFVTENKDRSIFRKNIGRALLHRKGSPLLERWELDLTTRQAREQHAHQIDSNALNETERRVSEYIREHLSFSVIRVDDKDTRMRLETGLIATINDCSRCFPSSDWLGLHSPKSKIRDSGLWLVQGLDGAPLASQEWKAIRMGSADELPRPAPPSKRSEKGRQHRPAVMRGKYSPLTEYLVTAGKDRIILSFQELQAVLGFELPKSARKYRPWWANQKAPHMSSQSKSWQGAGFVVDSVQTADNGWVEFRRASG